MKSKSIPIKKNILKYSILFGIAIIVFSFSFYITGNYGKHRILRFIILLFITVSCIMTGLIMSKKNNDRYISLIQALKIGIGISVLGGLMATLWEILLIKVIDPEIITQIEHKQIKRLAETSTDFTQENIDRKIAITKKFTSPLVMIVIALIEDLFVGFLISLIGGLIIRKKRDPFK